MKNISIAIIGGGLSGSMIAAQQIIKLIEHKTIADWCNEPSPQINIHIYEKAGKIGPGEPYASEGADADIFLLNQPAYAMSPFLDHPDHFSNWLACNRYPFGPDDFVPRGIYGRYLENVFIKAATAYKKSGCGHVQHITDKVIDVSKQANGSYRIATEKQRYEDADLVVLALGHSRSSLLSAYSGNSGYFSAPFDVQRAQSYLKEAKAPVMIVGTSQSMLDGLALLDYAGFSNSIYALSRNMVRPWVFDAQAERNIKGQYSYRFLTKELLSKPSALSFEALKNFFESDLVWGKESSFPQGHILSQFNASALESSIINPVTKENFKKLALYASALYGNPTSPQRYNLMQSYERKGQLNFLQKDITKTKITPASGGFKIQFEGQKPLKISAIFNSSCYSMKTICDQGHVADPLLNSLDKRGALKRHEIDKNAFESGEQNWTNLYLAGPCCNSQRWGVGTFKGSLENIASQLIRNLARSKQAKPV